MVLFYGLITGAKWWIIKVSLQVSFTRHLYIVLIIMYSIEGMVMYPINIYLSFTDENTILYLRILIEKITEQVRKVNLFHKNIFNSIMFRKY